MNVLIADDDAATRLILQSMLVRWGYDVIVANDGDEAWRILNEPDHPRLVILDWMMPGIEGPEIVKALRTIEGNSPHYVIITTSGVGENAPAMALDAGADDFVAKPFRQIELKARVNVGSRVTQLHEALAEKISKLETATETISRIARTDELTGLNNRRSFNENFSLELSSSRRHGHPLSLISIDLDHFKSVNDTFGHTAGDTVLKNFSDLLKAMVRAEDIPCRWGGEEFIILLPNTQHESATVLAERIRSIFEEKSSNVLPQTVTASFGVAQLSAGENEDALIRRVDEALYRAKREGRNRVVTV